MHAVKSAANIESKLPKQQLMIGLIIHSMLALIWRKIARIRFCIPVEWEWSAIAQRKGQTCCWMRAWRHAHMHGCSKRWDVSPRGRPCWVSQLCFSSREEVPAATNAVPDHGVNSLIFNAALHYAERSRLFQQHPLARRRRRRGKKRETSQPFNKIGPDVDKRSSDALSFA